MAKASDYLFGIMEDETDPNVMYVAMVEKQIYDTNGGYLESEHLGGEIQPLWPAAAGEMDEAQEAMFFINESLSYDQLKDIFVTAGFIHEPELDEI